MAFDPITAVMQLGDTLITRFFPDKSEQLQKKAEMQEMRQNGELRHAELQMSALIMEAKSKDKWTSRARPSFLYVMYVMILMSLPMGVLYAFHPEVAHNIALGMKEWLAAIPKALYGLFGIGYVGYGVCRTYDKAKTVGLLDKLF